MKVSVNVNNLSKVSSGSRCALRLRYAVYRDRPRRRNGWETAVTVFIGNISQADLQNVFANKIKRGQATIDTLGHHFQHIL
jgi:hypothetical protein